MKKLFSKSLAMAVMMSMLAGGEAHAIVEYAYSAGGGSARGDFSVAIGHFAITEVVSAVALGADSRGMGIYSTALGAFAQSKGSYSVALGHAAGAGGINSVALGNGSQANENNVISVGSGKNGDAFKTRRIINVADGIKDTDAATVGQLKAQLNGFVEKGTEGETEALAVGKNSTASREQATAVGQKAEASGASSTALGYEAKASGAFSTALGNATLAAWESTAVGNGAKASGTTSTALGNAASASGIYSTALGNKATAAGNNSTALGYDTLADGYNSTAVGNGSYATGTASVALGYGSAAKEAYSVALGGDSKASGSYSIALGKNAEASGTSSIALGENAKASAENSVALGDKSVADVANTVSVGSAGNERKIVNVAAGKIEENSTEAVNGGQLYYINAEVDDLINRVTTAQGTIDAQAEVIASALLERGIGVNNIDFGNALTGTVIQAEGEDPRLVIGLKDELGPTDKFTFTDKENRANYSVEVSAKGFVADDNTINGHYNSTLDETGLSVTKNGVGVAITADGIDMGGKKITNLGEGALKENSTDAVNGGQLYAIANVAENGNYIAAGTDVAGNLTALDAQVKANADAIEDNSSEIVKNRADIATNALHIEDNKKAIEDEVARAKDAEQANADAIEDEVARAKDAEQANADAIATEKTERINADNELQKQIKDVDNNLTKKINQTNARVDRVGATAAALAAINYQPMTKGQSQIAVGLGGYNGKKATALGLAYQFNERISGSVAGAANGSERMFNVGFNYLFGQHSAKDIAPMAANTVSVKEAELQAQVDSLKADNQAMQAKMAKLEAMVKALAAK